MAFVVVQESLWCGISNVLDRCSGYGTCLTAHHSEYYQSFLTAVPQTNLSLHMLSERSQTMSLPHSCNQHGICECVVTCLLFFQFGVMLLLSASTKVNSHGCNAHEVHHGTKLPFLATGFINHMFCCTAVLRSGPTFSDLVAGMPSPLQSLNMVLPCWSTMSL